MKRMTWLQRINRVTLLIVLVICLAIKVAHAYAYIKGNGDNIAQFSHVSNISNISSVNKRDKQDKQDSRRTEVVSSNILMVWDNNDGTLGHYNLNHSEFAILQTFAKHVGNERLEDILDTYKGYSKEMLLSYIEDHLNGRNPDLYVFMANNDNDNNEKDDEL